MKYFSPDTSSYRSFVVRGELLSHTYLISETFPDVDSFHESKEIGHSRRI